MPQCVPAYLLADIGFGQRFIDDVLNESFSHWLPGGVAFEEPCLRLAGF